MRTLVILFVLLVCTPAFGKESDPGKPANMHLLEGCSPAYVTMDTDDVTTQWWFDVELTSSAGTYEKRSYTFSNVPCCNLTRSAVLDLLNHLHVTERVKVGPCH